MIIGLSGKAQAGKDTFCEYLQKKHNESISPAHGDRHMIGRISFGDALKSLGREIFGWDGKKDAKGRRFLQVLGTEVGQVYDILFWVKRAWMQKPPLKVNYIVTDVRFPHEFDYIREQGGILIRIERTISPNALTGEAAEHPSETALDNHEFDYCITNPGESLEEYYSVIDELCGIIGFPEYPTCEECGKPMTREHLRDILGGHPPITLTDNARRYLELQRKHLSSEEEDETLLDEMDSIWHKLTTEEINYINNQKA